MINIEQAIKESKSKENVSNGGSQCFDFGDVVLVKYSCLIKYLKDGEHTRDKSEEIMTAINKKADAGVNTPRHLAIKRLIEDDREICYVMQEKCKGINCASMSKYGVTFEKLRDDLEFVLNIPFEHYKKLISDGCNLFEMGYEGKNKNLFYDSESGFWYIDFLTNRKDYMFDQNDPKKLFEALKYVVPKPIQIASTMKYGEKLTPEQTKIKRFFEYSIKAKTLLAIKSVLPNFERYEKIFLFAESYDYRDYLMKEKIINKNLMNLDSFDYEVFNELYEIVMSGLIDKVVNKGEKFWSIECNDIRNDSGLFNLQKVYQVHTENSIRREDFDSDYDYECEISQQFNFKMLLDLISRLEKLEQTENVAKFLSDADEKLQSFKRKM